MNGSIPLYVCFDVAGDDSIAHQGDHCYCVVVVREDSGILIGHVEVGTIFRMLFVGSLLCSELTESSPCQEEEEGVCASCVLPSGTIQGDVPETERSRHSCAG